MLLVVINQGTVLYTNIQERFFSRHLFSGHLGSPYFLDLKNNEHLKYPPLYTPGNPTRKILSILDWFVLDSAQSRTVRI